VFPLAEASLRESDRKALLTAFACVERLDPSPGTLEEIDRLVGFALPAAVGCNETSSALT